MHILTAEVSISSSIKPFLTRILRKSFQCSNGELHTLECHNDTVFDPEIGTCDFPENVVGCGGIAKNDTGGNGNNGNGTPAPTNPPAPRE